MVSGFVGLDDFGSGIAPHLTNADGNHTLSPDDIALIYDIAPLFNMNIDGAGQTIAIAGQSELEANFADIRAFQKKFNLPPNLPQVVPVGPSPGVTGAISEAAWISNGPAQSRGARKSSMFNLRIR
jgi:subtilase family serine protease